MNRTAPATRSHSAGTPSTRRRACGTGCRSLPVSRGGAETSEGNWRKDDDVRWQPSGAGQIAQGNPQGERGGVHLFGVPAKGNANFAWVQQFIHHPAPSCAQKSQGKYPYFTSRPEYSELCS